VYAPQRAQAEFALLVAGNNLLRSCWFVRHVSCI